MMMNLPEDQTNSLPIIQGPNKKCGWVYGSDGLLILGEKMKDLHYENHPTLTTPSSSSSSSYLQHTETSTEMILSSSPLAAKKRHQNQHEDNRLLVSTTGSMMMTMTMMEDHDDEPLVVKVTSPSTKRKGTNDGYTRKSVQFAATVQCRFIESRRKMLKRLQRRSSHNNSGGAGTSTSTGIASYWYIDDEIERMHNELMESVKMMQAKELICFVQGLDSQSPYNNDDDDYCVRGLERYRLRNNKAAYSLKDRMDSIDTVLWAQKFLRNDENNENDKELIIAIAYKKYSARCQRLAYSVAKNDEAYVNRHVR